jgi:hypothetical protein
MSDLSQLYTNQQNKVSLFIDEQIKLNNVYLPRETTNYTGDLTSQPVILGIDAYDPNQVTVYTALYQKPFFSCQGLNTPQNYTNAQVGANQTIIFGTGSQVINKNAGTFTPINGVVTDMPSGYYKISYSMSKAGNATCVEGSASVGIIVNGQTYGELQCPLGTLNANSGTSIVSNSVFVLLNTGNNSVNLYYNTNISAGEASIDNPSLTIELVSPYTA